MPGVLPQFGDVAAAPLWVQPAAELSSCPIDTWMGHTDGIHRWDTQTEHTDETHRTQRQDARMGHTGHTDRTHSAPLTLHTPTVRPSYSLISCKIPVAANVQQPNNHCSYTCLLPVIVLINANSAVV